MKSNKRKTRTQAELKAFRKKRNPQGEPTGVYPRSLARSIAKAVMRNSGWTHINRNFSLNWKRVFKKAK